MKQEEQGRNTNEVVIPRYIKRKVTPHGSRYWHYEICEDKTTSRLVVYRCKETGCLESFQKKDFIEKYCKNGEQPSKYERRIK